MIDNEILREAATLLRESADRLDALALSQGDRPALPDLVERVRGQCKHDALVIRGAPGELLDPEMLGPGEC